jgi:hypothetical protein
MKTVKNTVNNGHNEEQSKKTHNNNINNRSHNNKYATRSVTWVTSTHTSKYRMNIIFSKSPTSKLVGLLTAVKMLMLVLWEVTQCGLCRWVPTFRTERDASIFSVEDLDSIGRFASPYKPTRRHTPEDQDLHLHCRENPKSHIRHKNKVQCIKRNKRQTANGKPIADTL